LFQKFKSGANLVDAINLEQYTVKNQTRILAGLLEKIVE